MLVGGADVRRERDEAMDAGSEKAADRSSLGALGSVL